MTSLLQRPHEIDLVIERATLGRVGLMLYGSHARGTATESSDIDLLELVEAPPRAYSIGRCNVTQYTPLHLATVAARGSLFVRHLAAEGQVLFDDSNKLSSIIESYSVPSSYENLERQIEVASGVLDPQSIDFVDRVDGLGRLGLYLLRTSIYLSRAQAGNASFDLSTGLDSTVSELLGLRRQTHFSESEVRRMHACLIEMHPKAQSNRHGSVEAYIVANATREDLASLFAPVLGGTGTIDYGALSLPPF
jgi:hypothetical protein